MDGQDTGPASRRLEVEQSRDFAGWLAARRCALALTTGAEGRLVLIGAAPDGRLSVFLRDFDGAFGLHAEGQSLILGTAFQIWRLQNAVAPGRDAAGYDRLFVPRIAYTTGDVRAGDVALAADGTVLFANTLFSCIAAASTEFSFVPVWRPRFISRLAPDDRCHLTGFALEGGRPRYVTVAAESDEPGGWAARIGDGGAVIDVASGEPVVQRLAFPLAPRLEGERLWLGEGASGLFGFVEPGKGAFEEVAFFPGWISGVAFTPGFAIVATSTRRDGRPADGLPLEANLRHYNSKAQTALCVVDLATGETVHWLRLDGLAEIRAVAVLADTAQPAALGLAGDDIRRVLSIGPDRSRPRLDTV